MAEPRLLHLDDEPEIGTLVARIASQSGFEARTTRSAAEFKPMYLGFAPHFVVLDLTMPDMDGVQVLQFLAEKRCNSRILLCSGYRGPTLESALRLGEAYGLDMAGILHKPLRVPQLRDALSNLKAKSHAA